MNDRAKCFDVPKMHERQWRDYAKTADAAFVVGSTGDDKAAGFSEAYLPELYHRLYADAPREVPAIERDRSAAVRGRLHDLASELPEMETLRKRTVRDPLWAGMAATAIGDQVARALPDHEDAPDADAAKRILRGLQTVAREPGAADAVAGPLARAEGTAAGTSFAVAEQAAGIDESAVRTAIRAGVDAAHDAISALEDACGAFGWGEGEGGTSGAARDPGVALELARRVAGSETLKRIVELAGRLKATARAKRATKSDFARSEIVGIEPTDDFSNLVPGELAALGHPLTAADLCARVGERAAVGWELKGTEKSARGPIVIAIDQSGSMRGDRDAWAKAIALALLDAARRDRRSFGIVLYAGAVTDAILFPDPAKVDPREVLALLSHDANGASTRFAPPLAQALDWIGKGTGKLRRADVVHVTDGCAADEGAAAMLKRADAIGAHVYGIAVGTDGRALHEWAHEVAAITDVNADTPAVDLIFDGVL